MNYNRALDLLFESYLNAKPQLAGRLDREVRDPQRILKTAHQLDLLPPPQNVLKITGSKGKGTVARLCARTLQKYGKTGLLVSPEEIDHTDRMRVNGQSISRERFVACFEKLWSKIDCPAPPAYLSPYGLFFLIALQWFKEEGVELFVIETGRGVRHDEGGQLPAKIGVVTSVFLEHVDYLGPTLEDIRTDKLSITDTCEDVVIGRTHPPTPSAGHPVWFAQCQSTAREALRAFLGKKVEVENTPCASFGHKTEGPCTLIFEGLIARDSADTDFLNRLVSEADAPVHFFMSLPDDKDFDGVHTLLQATGGTVSQIILNGQRGFLSYDKARQHAVAYEGAFDDVDALKHGLTRPETGIVYFIGTQTFLRLIKRAYFQ